MRGLRERTDDDLRAMATDIRREQLRRADRWHTCRICSTEFLARAGAEYCSGRCRTVAHRRRAGAK